MKDESMGKLFFRHLVMALPWGIVFLVVFFISAMGIKQQVKEGIQYGMRTAIQETADFAFRYNFVVPVKQNIKEGFEFVARTAKSEIKELLEDPAVKQDVKEALEYSGEQLKK